jgi:peptidyl-prolyl cis-trans isomerase A (cyclophilin A)
MLMRHRSAILLTAFLCATVGFTACGQDSKPAKKEKTDEKAQEKKTETGKPHPGLADPKQANEKAPDKYKVLIETTKGSFTIEVTKAWSPLGAERFYNLVKCGFYDDTAFFRVLTGFMAQIGLHGDPKVSAAWRSAQIKDDPRQSEVSNQRGYVSFAMGGPNTRTTQIFINFADNGRLDGMGFTPFAKVVEGMEVVDKINAQYGETPNQGSIQMQGNAYLKKSFPNLDYIKKATIKS